jgi:lysozyme
MKFSNYPFLQRWEGLELLAYNDGGGVFTIGYGHTKGVKPGDKITLEQAQAFLDEDLAEAETAVNKSVKVPLNQNQYDALVSLAYNIGAGAFLGSTALARLNARNYTGAAEALTWWNKDGKPLKVVQGLVNRRAGEKELFLTPVTTVDDKEAAIRALLEEYTQKLKEIM